MLPKSDVKADTVIWMGQHTTRKGLYLFFLQHRVRSIRRVVTALLNEAAHWRKRQRNRAEKTERTYLKLKKERCFLPPAKAWGFPHRRF